MDILDNESVEPSIIEVKPTPKPLWIELFWLCVCVLLGLFLAQFLGLLAVLPFFDYRIDLFQEALASPFSGGAKIPLLIIQAITQVIGFVIAPFVFFRLVEKKELFQIPVDKNIQFYMPILVAFIMIVIMPANAWLIELNRNLQFPSWMAGFENWAMAKEKELEQLTLALTDLRTAGEIFLGIIVFALIPAIGEEWLFRGVLQRKLIERKINPHVAIIVTGIIFSAIHLQFYGFLPRMVLGILLGYLFWWTGNLTFSIIAHFVNNAFTLILIILRNLEFISLDIENTISVPIEVALGSLVSFAGLTAIFWICRKNNYTIL